MQILSIDVGTGTQDIYLFRSGVALENGFKLVMPSPTMKVRKQIQEVTRRGEGILLTGVMMGGGPCHWAAEDHLKIGFPLYATLRMFKSLVPAGYVLSKLKVSIPLLPPVLLPSKTE